MFHVGCTSRFLRRVGSEHASLAPLYHGLAPRSRVGVIAALQRPFVTRSDLSSFAATRMGSMSEAAADPVEDYRELARAAFWSDVFGDRRQLSCLDICTGTGRWVQAFSELVLRPRSMTASFDCVDLCSDSLEHCEARISKIPHLSSGATHCLNAGNLSALNKKFDLATNMHGLYAIPRDSLCDVVASMLERVAPDGTCIIALGDNNSFYLKYSNALVDCGVIPARYTSADDVADVLSELGVESKSVLVSYVEQTNDEQELRHFIENESGGNTWPAGDDRTDKALMSVVAPSVKRLLEEYAVDAGVHRFPQSVTALLVKR